MDFLDFIERSNGCCSKEDLVQCFDKAIARLGFDKFLYSIMRGSFANQGKTFHGLARSYSEEWMKHYIEKKYIDQDPTYRRALCHKGVFSWQDLCKETATTKTEKLVMSEAEEAGLKNGISVAIHGPFGEAIGFGFASNNSHEQLTPNQKSLLFALANQFHLAYQGLEQSTPQTKIKLTDRQREVLQWAAVGKSRPVISEIMQISEDTVDDHFRQIFKKLECNDRTVAVLKAIQLGLIRV